MTDFFKSKKCIVTGGAGFIGTNLVQYLCLSGADVVVVDDLSGGNYKQRIPKQATFHQLDVCETDTLTEVCKDADIIFHLAALPRVQFSIEHPFEAQRVNVDGTLSALEAARRAGVTRVVYAASSAAYGDHEQLPLDESLPAKPKSPYALHKYMGEHLCALWSEIHDLETVSLRFFNVYGPHMDPDGAYALVMGRFLKLRKEGKPLTITGDGEQTRDFVHVQDLVRALALAGQNDKVGNGEVFNVGSGKNTSINALAEMIGGEVDHVAARIEPRNTLADITYIHSVLGWKPEITIAEGVAELKKEWGIV